MKRQEFLETIEDILNQIHDIENNLNNINDNFVDSEDIYSKGKDKIDHYILTSFMDLDILETTIKDLKSVLTK
jgi:hypothetical protein